MATGFTVAQVGNYKADLDDILIRREYFSDGTLWGWGRNNNGALGDNTTANKPSPVQTIAGGTNWKQVAGGLWHSALIKTDGTMWVCGYNDYGQLGTNNTTTYSSPIQTVVGGNSWKKVACGRKYTVAIKTDGTLWSCGYNTNGELGDGTRTHKSSPIQTVAGGNNWVSVSSFNNHTAAIKSNGTLWLWGRNLGQLGDNTNNSSSSPIQTVSGGSNWVQVACGGNHTAAVKTDGTLWMWGTCGYGQLGDNTTTSKSSPVQTIAGGTNWKQVSCGNSHTAAIKTNGTLWTWGDNYWANGQLGDNTTIKKSSPIQTAAGGTNWKQVACGATSTAAIKTDGSLWTWGNNSYGQLGNNTATTNVGISSPIQTIAGGYIWKSVTCGSYHVLALTDLTF
jgi:alpha-tubulin suppressor-like RCC1 family protein